MAVMEVKYHLLDSVALLSEVPDTGLLSGIMQPSVFSSVLSLPHLH